MMKSESNWSVYILACSGRTYIGATTNPVRRLRQHNGEIKGGARSTRGRKWQMVCYVTGFPDRSSCYRWEKLVKMRARGLADRLEALTGLIHGRCPPGRRHYDVPQGLRLVIVNPEVVTDTEGTG